MRKWHATGRVFDRFEYLILLKTPHLDFGKSRLHQVEVLGCYCDHEGLCAQIDRAQRCGDAYDILALFQNRVTHYKQSFSCSGIELHEAWQASQWLCEILMMRAPTHSEHRFRAKLNTQSDGT